jgi:peptidoglycan hydrolase-like protein with peptidoglycan-binding domain
MAMQPSTQQLGNQRMGQDQGTRAVHVSRSQIKQIQQTLDKNGFKSGRVDGKLGPSMRSALCQFQQKKGIKANGKVTRQTLPALGVSTGSKAGGYAGNQPRQSGRAGYAEAPNRAPGLRIPMRQRATRALPARSKTAGIDEVAAAADRPRHQQDLATDDPVEFPTQDGGDRAAVRASQATAGQGDEPNPNRQEL